MVYIAVGLSSPINTRGLGYTGIYSCGCNQPLINTPGWGYTGIYSCGCVPSPYKHTRVGDILVSIAVGVSPPPINTPGLGYTGIYSCGCNQPLINTPGWGYTGIYSCGCVPSPYKHTRVGDILVSIAVGVSPPPINTPGLGIYWYL